MNYLDKEDRIIDLFQDSAFQDAIFVGASRDALSVYGAVHNRTKWRNWTNSSGKSDPPPDYFSQTYGLMMDVMRTDDHTRLNKYGKAVLLVFIANFVDIALYYQAFLLNLELPL